MDTHQIVQRLDKEQASDDCNWLISSMAMAVANVVESQSTLRFSVTVRENRRAYLYGRFELDIAAALEAGIIDKALRNAQPRIRIEKIGAVLYLKREGSNVPQAELQSTNNVVRLDMRNAYRWGFRQKTA